MIWLTCFGPECEILPNTKEVPSLGPAPTLPWAVCWWVFSVTEASKAFQLTRQRMLLPAHPQQLSRRMGGGRKVYLALSWSGSGCCGWEQNELLVMLQLIKPPTLWNTIKERMSLRCMCFPLSNSHYLRATGVCTNPAPTQLFIQPLKKVKSTSHRRLN